MPVGIGLSKDMDFSPTFLECQSHFTTYTYLELTSALFCLFAKTIVNLKIMMFDRQNKSIVYFYAIEFFFFTDMHRQLLHCIFVRICFAVTGPAERFKSVLGHP